MKTVTITHVGGISFTASADSSLPNLLTEVEIGCGYDAGSGAEAPRKETFVALWDTGGTKTAISANVVEKLGLRPIAKELPRIYTSRGIMEKPDAYSVSIELPNLVEFDTWEVMKVDLDYQIDEKETGAKRVDVLIGMDILSQGDFAVTHFEGKTCFSFRMPSIRRIDYNKPG